MAESEKFQHYTVERRPDGSLFELGRGAMGVTYKAYDTNLRVYVALKVINNAYLDSDLARQRFLREARAAAALQHPNVASVFHLGNDADCFFYAMEFVDGETVDARLRRDGPIPVRQALAITLQVTRALAAAEKQKLVHRDLKPANIMLQKHDEEDEEVLVKVIDFGLAKAAGKDGAEAATLTQGGFLGTPHFASPEQLEEKEVDIRSDIYSLGVTLWCMLLGKTPFSGSMAKVMSEHLYKPVPVEQLVGFAPAVVTLLRHMLEKNPADRPQTPLELRREIETVLQNLPAGTAKGSMVSAAGTPEESFATMATMVDDGGSAPGLRAPTAVGQALISPPVLPPVIPLAAPRISPPAPATVTPPAVTESPGVSKPPLMIPLVIMTLVLVAFAALAWAVLQSRKAKPIVATTIQPTPTPIFAAASPTPTTTTTTLPAPEPTAVAVVTPVPTAAATSPTPTPTPDAEAIFQQKLAEANALSDAENWPEAMTSLVALARLYPDKPEPKQRLEIICAHFIRDNEPVDQAAFEKIRVPLEDAAALGINRAMDLLAQNIRATDPDRALTLYDKAANAGDVTAMRQGGLLYSNRNQPGDMARAINWFEEGAKQGDAICNYAAGESFLLGKGVPRDPEKGLIYLEQAAQQDEPHALNRLGDYYYKAKKDYAKALSYLERARRLDWTPSLANLGVLYINGAGVPKDETGAAALFKEGAEKGDPPAMVFYAQCLEGGIGVATDPKLALQWYQAAADKGDAVAKVWLQKNGR